MKQQDFIDALYDAGWKPSEDTEYLNNIKALHRKLFPIIWELEYEITNIQKDLANI